MTLSNRFAKLRGEEADGIVLSAPSMPQAQPSTLSAIQRAQAAEQAHTPAAEPATTGNASEALAGLKERASQALYERLGSRISDSSLEESELHQFVKDELKAVVDEEQVPLSQGERQRLTREIIDDVLGHGPMQR